ncbi:hypothetical protein [Arthrospiribacter ruber]|uniref:Uncharacterized protein n=1 Tax=Arthrospiribacter ruber TaxID=2487934 RepID=A0A951MBU3_9BACT|nr:hypothetical protein [Arthrospiribacter ruber]MBW3468821.1 hypothetical protein [Arthrospiribacter ruber]
MKFIKTTFLLFLAITFCSALAPVYGQKIENYSGLEGFTTTSNIEILDDFSQTEGLIKIGDAFSKARGATAFSAINNLNRRAKRKLLEEATVRGASHVFITKGFPDDGIGLTTIFIGRLFTYQAIFYKSEDKVLSENQVKNILSGHRFVNTQNMSTNRNAFNANHIRIGSGKLFTIDENAELSTRKGKIYLTTKSPKPIGIIKADEFEIIGINENHILLSQELVPDKKYRAFLMKKDAK